METIVNLQLKHRETIVNLELKHRETIVNLQLKSNLQMNGFNNDKIEIVSFVT